MLFNSNKKSLSLIDLLDSWAPLTKKTKQKKQTRKKKCIPLITLLVAMVMHILLLAEAYSEPCQTSKMKSLAKIVNSF